MPSMMVVVTPRLAAIAAGLSAFSGAIRSVRPALEKAVDEVVRPAIRQHFDEEGPGWAPLSETTIARRGDSGPILDRHRGAIGLKYAAHQKSIWEFTGRGDEAGAFIRNLPGRVFYGVYHHEGTVDMPQRQFFYLSPEEEQRVAEVLDEWANAKLKLIG